jgi:hypothetical protein
MILFAFTVPYDEKPFPVPGNVPVEPAYHANDQRLSAGEGKNLRRASAAEDLVILPTDVEVKKTNVDKDVNSDDTRPPNGPSSAQSQNVGVVIGVLMTAILVLIVGIALVFYKFSRSAKSATPTHSLLNRKFVVAGEEHARFNIVGGGNGGDGGTSYTRYTATSTSAVNKMSSVYDRSTQETIYEEPNVVGGRRKTANSCSPPSSNEPGVYANSGGFLSLNRKYSTSDPVLSEDCCTDDYAEPTTTHMINMAMHSSNSFTTAAEENIYAVVASKRQQRRTQHQHHHQQQHSAVSTAQRQLHQQTRNKPVLQPLPISHYSRPLSPPPPQQLQHHLFERNKSSGNVFGGSGINIRLSPPTYTTVLTRRASSTAVSRPSPTMPRLPVASLMAFTSSPTSSVPPPHTTPSETATETATEAGLSTSATSRSSSNSTIMQENNNGGIRGNDDFFYAANDVCIPDSLDLVKLYVDLGGGKVTNLPASVTTVPQRPDSRIASAAAATIDAMSVKLNEVSRNHIEFVEKLGEGEFGEIHLCRLKADGEKMVAVKSLRVGCNQAARFVTLILIKS